MSEWKVSPLLDAMEVGDCFARRDGVACYWLRHPASGLVFVLKHISVPASDEQLQALLLSGAYADESAANEYFSGVAQSLVEEAERSKQLLDCPYILPFLGAQKQPKENGVGYDVFAVLPKRVSLQAYQSENAVSHLRGINLGIDICTALTALHEAGYVHANLKPENIFLSETGRFLLGDFGLISTQDLQYSVLPEQYKSHFTAPELREVLGGLNNTIDIYSLGMVLYRIYNGNHAPFEDEKTSASEADRLRHDGEALPAPIYADYELAQIIQTACAHDPKDRYQSPAQMRQVLEQYMQRNAVSDQLIVPPLVTDEPLPPLTPEEEEAFRQAYAETEPDGQTGEAPAAETPEPAQEAPEKSEQTKAAPEKKEKKKKETKEKTKKHRDPEKEKRSRKRKKRAWIWFTVLMLLFVAALSLYEFTDLSHGLYHYFVTVDSLETCDVTNDSISLRLTANMNEDAFTATCQDVHGNSFQSPVKNGVAVFTGLKPGTQYTLQVALEGFHKLSGITTCTTATMPETEVLTMSASTGSKEGSVLISLVVLDENVEPDEWTMTYGAEGETPRTVNFSGHSTQLDGLTVGTEYTFTLQGSDGLYLTGQTSASYVPKKEVLADSLRMEDLKDGTATFRWNCSENLPEEWTVSCTDPEGTELPVTLLLPEQTDEGWTCGLSVDGIVPGTGYLLKIGADGLFQSLVGEIPETLVYIDSFTAAADTEGLHLRWSSNREPQGGWLITYSLGEGETLQMAATAVGGLCDIESYVPGADYVLSLNSADNSPVFGTSTIELSIPEAERFHRLGLEGEGTTIGLYETPDKEDWTYKDLGGGTVKFHSDDRITVLITAAGTPEAKSDIAKILYVIRDGAGKVLDVRSAELAWNEMWDGKRWSADMPYIPPEPGDYSLTVYVSNERMGTIRFTVLSD